MDTINIQEAIKIASKDASQLSTDKDFAEVNAYSYWLITNTWYRMTYDIRQQAGDILLDCIRAYGLVHTIKVCATDADYILHGDMDACSDLCRTLISGLDLPDALQILRFPKRFSPLRCDLVVKDTKAKFLNTLNSVKMNSRREMPVWLTSRLREIIADITKGYSSENLAYDGYFSAGAVQNTQKCLAAKVRAWDFPYFLDIMYPLTSKDFMMYNEFDVTDYSQFIPYDAVLKFGPKTAKSVFVPKNYKAARVIAEEQSTRQWFLQAIRARLEHAIVQNGYSNYIPLEDQGVNQYLSYAGSVTQDTATVDLSSASDRVSMALVSDIFPQNVVRDIRMWRSSAVEVDGKVYLAHMCATSGSAICFVVESIVFFSIALCATQYVETLTGESLVLPSVYGDDIIIDTKAYDTLCDLLTMLGFVVNKEKSFTYPNMYRESCGVEFYNGIECTTKYYPRKPIEKNYGSVDSIIKLHNSLYEYWDVHVFLKKAIRDLVGNKFTSSSARSFVDGYPSDVLDPIAEPHMMRAPYDKAAGVTFMNEGHMVTKQRPTGRSITMPDMYYYVQFLMHGPMYLSELDKLLGVSTSRKRVDDCYSQYETIITFTPDI